MLNAVLQRKDLRRWVDALATRYAVIGPVDQGGGTLFQPIAAASDLDLAYGTTILPPVRWFYPDGEVLFRFRLAPPRVLAVDSVERPIALFGVHPCDLAGIRIMDEAMRQEPADSYYLARRESALLVGLACSAPCGPHAFCADRGTLEVPSSFSDLFLTDLVDRFLVTADTERGEAELSPEWGFQPASIADRAAREQVAEAARRRFPRRIHNDLARLASELRESYGSALWGELGEHCLSCGSCSLVCPTCLCFDVEDVIDHEFAGGCRVRRWDSCQRCEFARIGSGENFRERAGERQRHRILCKEVYALERDGKSSCVGCGRCGAACVMGIDLIAIYNRVLAHDQESAR